MAIALTAASVVGSGISRTSTPSYTVGASSTLLVCVISSSVQPSAVSYGGNAMTLASKQDTTDSTWTTLAYLLNPPTGANTFAFTLASGSITVCAADYSGVAAADGSAVTNFGASASLTTNVTLAGSGEWVVAGGIAAHLANVFQNTSNLTVETSDYGFLATALMDTAGAVGPGTVGFVTTISSTSPRQAVVAQAFTAATSSTAVTRDFTLPLAAGLTALGERPAPLASLALARADPPAPVEGLGAGRRDANLPTAALARVMTPAGYRGLGGVYGSAVAYWGLRALNESAAAAGLPAIQLQRASDNATMDIHLLPSGALDVASAAAFLAGTTGGVAVWYDQSGNGYHMAQPTQALQPQFQFAATPSGAPGLVFNAANTTVLRYDAGIPDTVAPLVCASFAYENFSTVGDHVYVDSVSGGNQGFQNEGGTPSWVAFFYSLNYITSANNAWHSVQLSLQTGASASNLYLDGASNPVGYTFGVSDPLISGPDSLGADTPGLGTFTKYFNGTLCEVGWFPAAATGAQLAAGYADQQAAWMTGAAPAGLVQAEAGAGQRADPPTATEWLSSGSAVAGDSLVRLESAARLAGDGGARLESAALLRGGAAPAAEFAAAARADPGLPAAWLRRQAADPGAPAEGLGRALRDVPTPTENTGATVATADALLPVEALRRQAADTPAADEELKTSRGDVALPAESLGGLERGNGLWAEWLARALHNAGTAFEFSGGVSVAVIADSGLLLEAGGIVRAEVWAAVEVTKGVVREARFPAELLVPALAGAGLPAAALLRVRPGPALAAEWLGQAVSVADALIPVEIIRAVVLATPGPSEGLAEAIRAAGSPTETTALLLSSPTVAAEVAAGVLGPSTTLPAQAQAMLRLATGAPAGWEARPLLLVSLSRLLASIGKRRILKE